MISTDESDIENIPPHVSVPSPLKAQRKRLCPSILPSPYKLPQKRPAPDEEEISISKKFVC